MSTFESSSSFAAPVATRSVSTRAKALRKTYNYNALTINTTPTYHATPYFEVCSDEEEERIRVALTPIVDEQHYSMLNSESDEDSTAINVTIQFGWIGTVRNALARVKMSLAALSEQKQKHHQHYHRVLSAFIIFALFFLVVMFGGSMAATNTVLNHAIITPSGSSTRIIPHAPLMPILPPSSAKANIVPRVVAQSPSHEPPSSVGRAARASAVMRRSTPPPSDELHEQQELLSSTSPSPHVEAPADAVIPVIPPYGTVSVKFRALYLRNLEQQHPQLEQQQRERGKRERWHPGNLAILFNGGHS